MNRPSPRPLMYSTIKAIPHQLGHNPSTDKILFSPYRATVGQAGYWTRANIHWFFNEYPEMSIGFFERFTGYRRTSVRKWLDTRKPSSDVLPIDISIIQDLTWYLNLKREGAEEKIKKYFDLTGL